MDNKSDLFCSGRLSGLGGIYTSLSSTGLNSKEAISLNKAALPPPPPPAPPFPPFLPSFVSFLGEGEGALDGGGGGGRGGGLK